MVLAAFQLFVLGLAVMSLQDVAATQEVTVLGNLPSETGTAVIEGVDSQGRTTYVVQLASGVSEGPVIVDASSDTPVDSAQFISEVISNHLRRTIGRPGGAVWGALRSYTVPIRPQSPAILDGDQPALHGSWSSARRKAQYLRGQQWE
ncbi:hypothetical protein B0H19DRAFT_1225836 [Mycena capillaripes]|nr:hypothetical protein B0H19DRAFT_1225836 [Mycena capillaripes]